jgi:hypothetical protein
VFSKPVRSTVFHLAGVPSQTSSVFAQHLLSCRRSVIVRQRPVHQHSFSVRPIFICSPGVASSDRSGNTIGEMWTFGLFAFISFRGMGKGIAVLTAYPRLQKPTLSPNKSVALLASIFLFQGRPLHLHPPRLPLPQLPPPRLQPPPPCTPSAIPPRSLQVALLHRPLRSRVLPRACSLVAGSVALPLWLGWCSRCKLTELHVFKSDWLFMSDGMMDLVRKRWWDSGMS